MVAPAKPKSCLTQTPAADGTPFPCAVRVTKYNSNEFWAWSDEENTRRDQILGAALSSCGDVPPEEAYKRNTTHLSVHGCSGESGRWNRCWVVPMTGDPADPASVRPTCSWGDHFDVMIQNDVAKVAIDRVIDLDNGAYELQFYIRKRGLYNITVDKMVLHHQGPAASNVMRLTAGDNTTSIIGHIHRKEPHFRAPTVTFPATPHWPRNTETFIGNYSGGVDVIPLPQRCDEVYDADRFRFGAWYRVGSECDDVHCVGKGLQERKMDGWLHVSDVCILSVFTHAEMVRLVAESWIVGWGGSTMKQPLSNFVEYYLAKPIFKVFMGQLDSLKKSKRRPSFFSYRQWDITPFESTRISMQWGGCPNLVAGPQGCTTLVGIGNWGGKMLPLFGNPPASDTAGAPPSFPSALLIDPTVWRYPQDDDPEYFRTVDTLFSNVAALTESTKRRRPLIVWHTTPTAGNSERGHRPASLPSGTDTMVRNFNWFHEDFMAKYRKDPSDRFVMISRHLITLPLHFGVEWVHFGLHYGASEGMCNTGHERKGYEFAYCVCKTWGDDAVILAWLNAFAEYKRNVMLKTEPSV